MNEMPNIVETPGHWLAIPGQNFNHNPNKIIKL